MRSRARLNTLALTVDICLRYLCYILDSLGKHCLNTLLRVSPYKNASGLDPVCREALHLALNFQSTFLRYIQLNLCAKPSHTMSKPHCAAATNYALQLRVTIQSIRDRRVSGKFRYHSELSLLGSIYGQVTTPPTIPAHHFTLHRN